MYRGSDWDYYRYDPMFKFDRDPYRMDEYRKDKWKHQDFDRFRRDHHDKDKDWKKYEKKYKKYDKYDKYDKHDKHDKHHKKWKKDKHHDKDKHHKWDKEKEKHHDHDKKWKAVCDMGETDEYWMVRAEIPGVRKDNLCVEMEGKHLIICGKKKKEFWHDKLLKRGPRHNQNCTCGDNCTCHPTCKCGVSTVSKDEKGKAIDASLRGDVKDSERKGELMKDRKDMKMDKHMTWWKKERGGKGKFKRKIHLPKRVDHTAIEALYKDGVLEVLIKKPMGEKRLAEGGHTIPVH